MGLRSHGWMLYTGAGGLGRRVAGQPAWPMPLPWDVVPLPLPPSPLMPSHVRGEVGLCLEEEESCLRRFDETKRHSGRLLPHR